MSNQPLTAVDALWKECLRLCQERRFDEALVRAQMLLERDDLPKVLRARVHETAAWILYEGLRRPSPQAALHAEESALLYRECGDRTGECAALFGLLSCYNQLCEHAAADPVLDRIATLLAADPDAVPYGPILLAIATYVVRLGQDRLEEAMACLERAESLCTGDDTRFLRHDIWRRRAYLLLKMGRPEEAARWMDQAEVVSGQGIPLHSRSLYWTTRAQLEAARGNWDDARRFATNALALAQEMHDATAMAECYCVLALADGAQGQPGAWRRARLAVEWSIRSGRRDVRREVRQRVGHLLDTEEAI